jgi:uncharacterized protein
MYCHDWRGGPHQIMSFAVQAHLFQKALSCPSFGTVHIIVHGGEPTLIGRRAFLRILMLQRWFRRPGQQVYNHLQTNATTLNAAWIRFLARYRFQVGASIDGPPEIHDRTRSHADGRPSFGDVLDGIRKLRNAGLLGGVCLVVTDELVAFGADRIIRFLQKEGITRIGLLAMSPKNRPEGNDHHLDRHAYIRFLLAVHRARQMSQAPWIRVRELDAALRSLRGEVPGSCELQGNCFGAVFHVEPNGSVAHCDKFVGDATYTLGNVLREDFDQMRRGPSARRVAAQLLKNVEPHQACRFFRYCRGWCPHETYLTQIRGRDVETSSCPLAELFHALERESCA